MDHATTVENAVKRFYASGDNEIHSWLLQAQASREAWTFVWQLLDPSKSAEVQLFAATTLHAKISKQWEEVPKSEYLALQTRIFEVLKSPGTAKVALPRLCQALAVFIIIFTKLETEQMDKCTVELLADFLPYNSPTTVGLLVKVLEAIPNEISPASRHNYQKCCCETKSTECKMRTNLQHNWIKTVWILQQVLSACNQTNDSISNALCLSCVECVLSWLKLGQLPLKPVGEIFPYLLNVAARYLPNKDDSEDDIPHSWETIQECISMLVTHTELYSRPQLLWEWAKSLMCMICEHGAKHYYDMLTAFGEAHSRTFLVALVNEEATEQQKWAASQLIQFLLECSEQEGRYPIDERRSCIPFGFWYSLQDNLGMLDEPVESRARNFLKPVYARLAQALLRKATLPSSPSEAGTPEDSELLRCYRQDAADTLTYCYNVLGEDLFILLGQRLNQTHNDVSKWTEVESTIHAFKALCDDPCDIAPHYIASIMELLLSHIPYRMYPREVLCCACWAIGSYAIWINHNPDPWLERSLQLVVTGLSESPITAPAASMALKDIARDCEEHLTPLAPAILEIISRTLPTVPAGGGEGLRLMYATGKLLKSLRTSEEQLTHLEAILGPCLVRLRELLQRPVAEGKIPVINQLKMIAVVFASLDGGFGSAVLEALLPIFGGIISHPEWSRDDATLEVMYNCAVKSLASLKHPDREVKPLLAILSTSYRIRQHPAALTFLKQVLTLRRDPDNVVAVVFREISEETLRGVAMCRQVNGSLEDLSDLLESYFMLLSFVCKKSARLLLQLPDQLPEMLRCGIACLSVPISGTVKAASTFLCNAIIQSSHLQTFIYPIGQELVCVIMQCTVANTPRNNLEYLSDVLLALNKTCIEWMSHWLRVAIEDTGVPIPLTQNEKDLFVRQILREQRTKLRIWMKLKEFSIQCQQPVVVP